MTDSRGFTNRDFKDLLVLVRHSKIDIDFGVMGSFGDGVNIFKKDIEAAKRAINNIADITDLLSRGFEVRIKAK